MHLNKYIRKPLYLLMLFAQCMLSAQTPAIPTGLVAVAYEDHVELTWNSSSESFLTGYKIFRAPANSGNFTLLKQVGKVSIATDWTGDEGQNLSFKYKIQAIGTGGGTSGFSDEASATTHTLTDEQLLEMAQRATF